MLQEVYWSWVLVALLVVGQTSISSGKDSHQSAFKCNDDARILPTFDVPKAIRQAGGIGGPDRIGCQPWRRLPIQSVSDAVRLW